MKLQRKYLITTAAFVAGAGAIGSVGNALVSADTSTNSKPANSIARYTVSYDRLAAEAEVLNTTPAQLENQLKTQTMAQIIKAAGFTKATFRQKVVAQLKTDLQNQGYSQTQINNALSKHHGHHGPKNP